jgi:threonine dehydratase
MDTAIGIERVQAAGTRLAGVVRCTPLLGSPALDALAGRRVLVKAECLQHTGSFKFRGAWAALSALPAGVRARGVVAYSSGNHGQAVAYAARRCGVPAAIVMPADAPAFKIASTRAHGAEVLLYDRVRESREALGEALCAERGMTLIKPYDALETIAGQGSVGLELVAQLGELGVRRADVLVCCGGGGLAAGIATAFASLAPGLRVRTCEPQGFDDTARSLAAGDWVGNATDAVSLCDALLTPVPGRLTLPVLLAHAGPGLVVTDRECLRAMAVAATTLKLVLEPGGAAALAAALFRSARIDSDPVVVIASGGNVAPQLLGEALRLVDADGVLLPEAADGAG